MGRIGKHTLTVGSKKIELTVSLWALRLSCLELGCSLEELLGRLTQTLGGNGGGVLDVYNIFCTVIAHAANENIPPDALKYTTRDVFGWVEAVGFSDAGIQGAVKAVIESISSTILGEKRQESTGEKGTKKNLTSQRGMK